MDCGTVGTWYDYTVWLADNGTRSATSAARKRCRCIGSVHVEISVKHVRCDRTLVTGISGVHEAAFLARLQTVFMHQTLDVLFADANAVSAQLAVNARASVRAASTRQSGFDFQSSCVSATFFGDVGRSTHA
jgi:hypothetical protein